MRTLPTNPKLDPSYLLGQVERLTRAVKLAGIIPCCHCGEFHKAESHNPTIVALGDTGLCLECLLGDGFCNVPEASVSQWAKALHPFYVKVSRNYLSQPYWTERAANARAAAVWAEMQRGATKYSRQPIDGDALKFLLEELPDADKVLKYIISMGGIGKVGLNQNPQDWKWCEWLGAYLTPADYALSKSAWIHATADAALV